MKLTPQQIRKLTPQQISKISSLVAGSQTMFELMNGAVVHDPEMKAKVNDWTRRMMRSADRLCAVYVLDLKNRVAEIEDAVQDLEAAAEGFEEIQKL